MYNENFQIGYAKNGKGNRKNTKGIIWSHKGKSKYDIKAGICCGQGNTETGLFLLCKLEACIIYRFTPKPTAVCFAVSTSTNPMEKNA